MKPWGPATNDFDTALHHLKLAVATVPTPPRAAPEIARTNDWALPRDTLNFLDALSDVVEPHHVLEFGSGNSTLMFARANRRTGRQCEITSVEHDPRYAKHTIQRLEQEGLALMANVLFAPLGVKKYGDSLLPAYHLDNVKINTSPADLILIDAPPEILGGREGILYQAMEFARRGTIVLLDDANRVSERKAVQRWERTFGDLITTIQIDALTRPLAAIVIGTPVTADALWNHNVRTAISEIVREVPPRAQLLLADENAWGTGEEIDGRRTYHFSEADSSYAGGPPADSAAAIARIDDHRARGIQFLVLGAPAFWWLEHYKALHEYISTNATQIFESPRVVIFRFDIPN